ncbi:olfactory receptor [Crotalus adamanteus]|uniref:Olfactory receptor n=1 Tax=Crotalus adamanteus TaxID=8729 RepID=A0AAW1B638_CROAD|nr:olfactory receptor 14A16-like [Crotalus tigris]XP_039185156.1 olfactory receptor 14A16-like [Crotalus tigris]XP_039185157.1 olfactory receptor 14A16-like [Crotalus tigris]XP_039185159.1 olfactory receptor 14A16-like [Crotalus tigris]KAG6505863.1 olfactory receptor [Crotalus adamanteus]
MENQTTVSYFLLLELSKNRHLQLFYFFLFLVLYLATLAINLLIISAITLDHRLQGPMYYFLMNLAVQDLGIVSVIVPKSMNNSLMDTRHISYFGCVAQIFLLLSFEGADYSLLTVMAYDRYVAICHSLHYEMMMNQKACTEMIIAVWIAGLLYGTIHSIGTFSTPLCSNVINQFFCETPQLLKLSCSGFNLLEVGIILACITAALGCFIFMIISYAVIFRAVLRMPSDQSKQKALSTCIPHLIVVSMYLLSGCFAYGRPPSNTPSYLDFGFTALYSLLPPLFNPIIYSMRNKNIGRALSQLWRF